MKRIVNIIIAFILMTIMNAQQIAKNDIVVSEISKLNIMKMMNPADDVYDGIWDNTNIHCYKDLNPLYDYSINLLEFNMPVDKEKIVITSKYGYRKKFKRHHNGVDIDVNIGDTIYAVYNGKVRISTYSKGGYGKHIVIRHNNGLETFYAHMSRLFVDVNTNVKAGQPIGLGGNTGRSTGPHLHLEIRFCGNPIDPMSIFDFEYKDIINDKYLFKKS